MSRFPTIEPHLSTMNNISEEHSVTNMCNIVIGCSVSVYVVSQRNLVPFSFENKH